MTAGRLTTIGKLDLAYDLERAIRTSERHDNHYGGCETCRAAASAAAGHDAYADVWQTHQRQLEERAGLLMRALMRVLGVYDLTGRDTAALAEYRRDHAQREAQRQPVEIGVRL